MPDISTNTTVYDFASSDFSSPLIRQHAYDLRRHARQRAASNILYIGQNGYNNIAQQVMKSTDGGATWVFLSGTPPNTAWVNNGGPARVKLSPANSSIVWALTGENQGHGMYYSANGGTTWLRKAQPLGGQWSGLYGVAPSLVDVQKVVASGHETWYATVARTLDGNATWTTLTTVVGMTDLARHPQAEDILFGAEPFASTSSGRVRISLDGGVTWNDLPVGWTQSLSVVAR